ncbi:MAG: PDZ domain-containing protein [Planctomycetales bacterium]|nr:PDZ domain-containing protein [Planctomycetales bacterium]
MATATRRSTFPSVPALALLAIPLLLHFGQAAIGQNGAITRDAQQAKSETGKTKPPSERSDEALAAGQPERGWLGVVLEDTFSPMGVLVVGVAPDSPAARAGIRPGDLIRRLDDFVPQDALDVAEFVQSRQSGDNVTLTLFRGNILRRFLVTLTGVSGDQTTLQPIPALSGAVAAERVPVPNVLPHVPPRAWLGVETAPVTNLARRVLFLPNNKGAIVNFVYAGSPAERAGIRPGAVIRAIDSRDVTNPYDVSRLVAETGAGRVVDISLWVDRGPLLVRLRLAPYPPDTERSPTSPRRRQ